MIIIEHKDTDSCAKDCFIHPNYLYTIYSDNCRADVFKKEEMSKAVICDICQSKIMSSFSMRGLKTLYRFSYFHGYLVKDKVDVCESCLEKFKSMVMQMRNGGSK